MIENTTEYSQFKLREDNRLKINKRHIINLCESITRKDLLYMRPIAVNEKMEVLDGQHRLLAAQALGVPIYYEMKNELMGEDIILLNLSRSWGATDYFNYYCQNQYPEYLKLKEFSEKYDLKLKLCMRLLLGRGINAFDSFKKGEFIFNIEGNPEKINTCLETIKIIRQFNGTSPYVVTTRFWEAMIKFMEHEKFDNEKWFKRLTMHSNKINIRATVNQYVKCFLDVYNHSSHNKIFFHEFEGCAQ
jgi:hypothetical protein